MSPPHLPPELAHLLRLTEQAHRQGVEVDEAAQVVVRDLTLPVPVFRLGSREPSAPSIGFFGGVHGLERIGAAVVLAHLESVLHRLGWDRSLNQMLEHVRMVFMPLVNPGGLCLGTRANPAGIDLMRNSPVQAQEATAFLVGGQRVSAAWPWYQGPPGQPMQAESAALCRAVSEHLLPSRLSIALDCHSGFGLRDRLWFPHAHTRKPIEHLAEMHALVQTYEGAHRHHPYVFEPQSTQYLTHGDLWDHLYLAARDQAPERVFLPLTLEMGSWMWVKKNPRQLFSRHGIFNPQIEHRLARVLRRHGSLLDFMGRAAAGHELWQPATEDRAALRRAALSRWYGWPPESFTHDMTQERNP